MNREEVIALANKFDMRKGRRPRVSTRTTTATLRVQAVANNNYNNTRPIRLGSNPSIPIYSTNNINNTHRNTAVLSTRSEVEAAARLYDERLARASAYARKRRRDGKTSTANKQQQNAPSPPSSSPPNNTSAATPSPPTIARTYSKPAKNHQLPPSAIKVPAPIVTSYPSGKAAPTNSDLSNSHAIAPSDTAGASKAGVLSNTGNPASTLPVTGPALASSPPSQPYSSTTNVTANIASADPYETTPKPQEIIANNRNPHHVVSNAASAPLSSPGNNRNDNLVEIQPNDNNTAPMNLASSFSNTHQNNNNDHTNQVMDLPTYPTFVPEQPSASFDALPIYGPHLHPEQYTTSAPSIITQHQQNTNNSNTTGVIHYAQTTTQEQHFVEPQHPTTEDQFNQVTYETQVVNGVGYGTGEINQQTGSDTFVQSSVEYGGNVAQLGQSSTFGDGQTGIDPLVFDGPVNVVYATSTTTTAEGTDVDPVSVEQTAQTEEYVPTNQGAQNNDDNGDIVHDRGEEAQLFHEYDMNREFNDDAASDYAHLIPPDGQGVGWENTNTNIDTNETNNNNDTSSSVHGFQVDEENEDNSTDTLEQLGMPAKKRRFLGMQQIFNQETQKQ